ncbi:HAMP domain-containing sensor histidine kinase [Streptomyces sp. NPDC048420]|uniref:HAMP domain-containing sensor histidine kinase n=1 Tax=Streptomyces sp. NPDC048420 TaxID=3155755 RepID=UPI00342FD879
MNIGTKVALAVAAAAVTVAAVIGVLVHRVTAAEQLSTARSELDRQLVSAAYDYAAARRSPARINPPDLPGPVARAVRGGSRVTYLHDGRLWAATQVADREVLALSRSYAPEIQRLATLDRTLTAVGAGATVLVSLAGLALGVRMGRRAMAAARTAESIADGRLDARARPDGRDEIARLSVSVNTMADALGARLEAERRVTADIAHELRTPVAGMSTAAGLLPPGPATDLIVRSVKNLRSLVEDVLEVARMDARVAALDTEERQVSAMARRAVTGLGQTGQGRNETDTGTSQGQDTADDGTGQGQDETDTGTSQGQDTADDGTGQGQDETATGTSQGQDTADDGNRRVRVVVVADAVVVTDPRRVERVLANLVSNALRHGAPPVEVEVDGPVVRVRDRGEGFPADLLAVLHTSGPQRFRTTAPGTGTGLGLTIAVGQARLLGARLTFRNRPDGGAEAVLRLPERPPG